MPSSEYLVNFSDDDVYTMLYLYHLKGNSLEDLQCRFSIEQEALQGFLGGWHRKECYESFKVVEKILQAEE